MDYISWFWHWITHLNWNAVGSVATGAGALIAGWQIARNTAQARTDFEDDLSREYRDISRQIPIEAQLGGQLSKEEYDQALPAFFQYIDLWNEQVFLRVTGRVSRSTWEQWCDGIQSTLQQPMFARAWSYVKERNADGFTELRKLEQSAFQADPLRWVPRNKRIKRFFFS